MDVVARDDERAWVSCLLASWPGVNWGRLLFSAKETVYKTWYPMNRGWLDFNQIAITIEPAGGTFSVRLGEPSGAAQAAALTCFAGRWLARDGLLLTAIAVPWTVAHQPAADVISSGPWDRRTRPRQRARGCWQP
jgi:4'-phosphopantetheinyl transferase EntD